MLQFTVIQLSILTPCQSKSPCFDISESISTISILNEIIYTHSLLQESFIAKIDFERILCSHMTTRAIYCKHLDIGLEYQRIKLPHLHHIQNRRTL